MRWKLDCSIALAIWNNFDRLIVLSNEYKPDSFYKIHILYTIHPTKPRTWKDTWKVNFLFAGTLVRWLAYQRNCREPTALLEIGGHNSLRDEISCTRVIDIVTYIISKLINDIDLLHDEWRYLPPERDIIHNYIWCSISLIHNQWLNVGINYIDRINIKEAYIIALIIQTIRRALVIVWFKGLLSLFEKKRLGFSLY